MRIVYKGNYIRMTCGEIGLVRQMILHEMTGTMLSSLSEKSKSQLALNVVNILKVNISKVDILKMVLSCQPRVTADRINTQVIYR